MKYDLVYKKMNMIKYWRWYSTGCNLWIYFKDYSRKYVSYIGLIKNLNYVFRLLFYLKGGISHVLSYGRVPLYYIY